MHRLQTFLILPLVMAFHSHYWISGSVIELIVRPGDNIILYCDCKVTTEELIVWYRNCSHKNQPPLVLQLKEDVWKPNHHSVNSIPHFHFVKNQTSKSYDLLIENITGSDVGLYYCGTEERKLEQKAKIQLKYVHRYGNVTTRILFDSIETFCPNSTHRLPPEDCNLCWILLFTLCPAFVAVSSLVSYLLVHQFGQKTAKDLQGDEKKPDTREQIQMNLEGDVCYAAVKFQHANKRLKKKETQRFDSSSSSVVHTRRV